MGRRSPRRGNKMKRMKEMKEMKEMMEDAWEEEECQRAKCVILIILFIIGAGPLLCLTVQQVCITKCLITRRLPKLARDFEDIMVVLLFTFYVLLNYIALVIFWSVFRKFLRFCYLAWLRIETRVSMPNCVARWILMDPKITRSGKVYGYRKAKYVNSETENRTPARK